MASSGSNSISPTERRLAAQAARTRTLAAAALVGWGTMIGGATGLALILKEPTCPLDSCSGAWFGAVSGFLSLVFALVIYCSPPRQGTPPKQSSSE